MTLDVPFLDLSRHHAPIREEVLAAWADIYDSSGFVSGRHVASFESAFAAAHGASSAVAVSTGTAALELALRAVGVGPGDKAVVPVNTFIATAEAVSNVGAQPVFVDCDDTGTIDVDQAVAALSAPGVAAIVPVHLYGHPADLDPIIAAAAAHGVAVIEDAAQAHLARYRGDSVGGLGIAAGFSFYAGKNLGAPGEGGAVTTNDPALADRIRALRDHGQAERYRSEVVGGNARMMELVAAMLDIKLARLHAATEERRRVAARYQELLGGHAAIELPIEAPWATPVYHLYVIHVDQRDRVRELLAARGVSTRLHYPMPLHLQPAYRHLGYVPGTFPVAERKAARLVSLPMFPELNDDEIELVAKSLLDAAHTLERT
ncbi:MAG: DegT/DnrJ/EryC1/StrS family aminotransferase [Acidobacteria bacterium]|nr:DegT/DnrJ/EryC1/StrS family aminotransferase [Acidobacteriota bacterium]